MSHQLTKNSEVVVCRCNADAFARLLSELSRAAQALVCRLYLLDGYFQGAELMRCPRDLGRGVELLGSGQSDVERMNEIDPPQCQCEQDGDDAGDPKSFVVAFVVVKRREETQGPVEVVAERIRVESARERLCEEPGAPLDGVCYAGRVARQGFGLLGCPST